MTISGKPHKGAARKATIVKGSPRRARRAVKLAFQKAIASGIIGYDRMGVSRGDYEAIWAVGGDKDAAEIVNNGCRGSRGRRRERPRGTQCQYRCRRNRQ